MYKNYENLKICGKYQNALISKRNAGFAMLKMQLEYNISFNYCPFCGEEMFDLDINDFFRFIRKISHEDLEDVFGILSHIEYEEASTEALLIKLVVYKRRVGNGEKKFADRYRHIYKILEEKKIKKELDDDFFKDKDDYEYTREKQKESIGKMKKKFRRRRRKQLMKWYDDEDKVKKIMSGEYKIGAKR